MKQPHVVDDMRQLGKRVSHNNRYFQVHETTSKADGKIKEITKLRNQIKNITSEYMRSISEDRFRNFLRRIFEKRYKASKEEDGNFNDLFALLFKRKI